MSAVWTLMDFVVEMDFIEHVQEPAKSTQKIWTSSKMHPNNEKKKNNFIVFQLLFTSFFTKIRRWKATATKKSTKLNKDKQKRGKKKEPITKAKEKEIILKSKLKM